MTIRLVNIWRLQSGWLKVINYPKSRHNVGGQEVLWYALRKEMVVWANGMEG
jgi:hypothetical protein